MMDVIMYKRQPDHQWMHVGGKKVIWAFHSIHAEDL